MFKLMWITPLQLHDVEDACHRVSLRYKLKDIVKLKDIFKLAMGTSGQSTGKALARHGEGPGSIPHIGSMCEARSRRTTKSEPTKS